MQGLYCIVIMHGLVLNVLYCSNAWSCSNKGLRNDEGYCDIEGSCNVLNNEESFDNSKSCIVIWEKMARKERTKFPGFLIFPLAFGWVGIMVVELPVWGNALQLICGHLLMKCGQIFFTYSKKRASPPLPAAKKKTHGFSLFGEVRITIQINAQPMW